MQNYKLFLLAIIGLLYSSCQAQKPAADFLEGKVFTIHNYINGVLDNTEDILFSNGKMEGTVCTEYGFQGAEYRIKKQTKKELEFVCTMYSSVEGKMIWNGTATKNKVEGTCLWTKEGQDPILLDFDGRLKN